VLEQQQCVVGAGDPGVSQVTLPLPGAAVVDDSELANLDRGLARPDGSDHVREVTRVIPATDWRTPREVESLCITGYSGAICVGVAKQAADFLADLENDG
jgi:hypothetical protein